MARRNPLEKALDHVTNDMQRFLKTTHSNNIPIEKHRIIPSDVFPPWLATRIDRLLTQDEFEVFMKGISNGT